MTIAPKPGIYDTTFEEYVGIDAFNSSSAKHLATSPAHCRAYRQGLIDKDTAALRFGRLIHTAIFEPKKFGQVPVSPFADFRTNEAKLWKAANPNYLTQNDVLDIKGISDSVRAHKEANRLLSQAGGKGERTVVAKDKETGLLLKARIDFLALAVVDGKSTRNANPAPHGFPKQAANLFYHIQEAFYRRVLEMVEFKYSGFIFLAFEKEPPYAVTCMELDKRSVDKGREEVERLLWQYKGCVESNAWPAYSEKVEPVTIPEWALRAQPFQSAEGYVLEEV